MPDETTESHDHATPGGGTAEEVVAFWEAMYLAADQVWSGKPNAVLVDEVADLPPGRALDLGSGEGGDAIWLAGRGWTVVGVDVSAEAVRRAQTHAAAAGVADRATFERHDLSTTFPDGRFDLVSAQFFQSPVALDRAAILQQAAARVVPGGTLLVVGHAQPPPGSGHQHDPALMPAPPAVLAQLDLDPEAWEVERAELHRREGTGRHVGTLVDSVVRAHRLPV